MEANESEGEEMGSPPKALAGLSHTYSKSQQGQIMDWGFPERQGQSLQLRVVLAQNGVWF